MIHKKNKSNLLENKLFDLLQGASLNDLPLDFIETTFFSDLYQQHEVLGSGSFGVVVRVTELLSKEDYAMKVISFIL